MVYLAEDFTVEMSRMRLKGLLVRKMGSHCVKSPCVAVIICKIPVVCMRLVEIE